jgi:hypothetical protein
MKRILFVDDARRTFQREKQRSRMKRRPWGAAAAAIALLTIASTADAGPVSASELKAAFLFNFVRFAEWPRDALTANGPLVVCLMDETGVGTALQQLVKGRTAGSREVEVRLVRRDGDFAACNVAYLSGVDAKRADELVSHVKDSAVLTVSDDERFADRGGIANFFVEHGNMGFAVNVVALQHAKLQLSAKLLALARIVRR